MKALKYISLILLSLVVISCEIDKRDLWNVKRTASGKLVYNNTSNMLGEYLNTFNFLQSVDLYINATDLAQKDSIEDALLPHYKIRSTLDGVYTIKGNLLWTINTANKSLNQTGTSWSVSCKYYGYDSPERIIIPVDGFVVECTAPETWELNIKGCKNGFNSTGTASLYVERLDKRTQTIGINSDYSVAGTGHIFYQESGQIMDIDYTTVLPMVYRVLRPLASSKTHMDLSPDELFWFYDGIINMSVTNTTHSVPQDVKADLTASVGEDVKVKITFRGITEVWGRYDYWNY